MLPTRRSQAPTANTISGEVRRERDHAIDTRGSETRRPASSISRTAVVPAGGLRIFNADEYQRRSEASALRQLILHRDVKTRKSHRPPFPPEGKQASAGLEKPVSCLNTLRECLEAAKRHRQRSHESQNRLGVFINTVADRAGFYPASLFSPFSRHPDANLYKERRFTKAAH